MVVVASRLSAVSCVAVWQADRRMTYVCVTLPLSLHLCGVKRPQLFAIKYSFEHWTGLRRRNKVGEAHSTSGSHRLRGGLCTTNGACVYWWHALSYTRQYAI